MSDDINAALAGRTIIGTGQEGADGPYWLRLDDGTLICGDSLRLTDDALEITNPRIIPPPS